VWCLLVELVWEKKYDKSGAKSAPVSVALPFQTIETLNESTQQRQKSIESFLKGRGEPEWRNLLIWGDKKYVLPSLLRQFANAVDLIYIDPPFGTGEDYSYHVDVPDGETPASFTKLPSVIEQKAYRDTWGERPYELDSYLRWFYDTLLFLAKLLKPTGSLYIHLDWHIAHYAKIVADEVFGYENFQNEVIWKRKDAQSFTKRYGVTNDIILFYTKSAEYTWNPIYEPLSEKTADKWYKYPEEADRDVVNRLGQTIKKGTIRRYNKADLSAPGDRTGTLAHHKWKGKWPPKGRHWQYTVQDMERLEKENRLIYSKSGMVYEKRYLDESKGTPLSTLWTDISMVRGMDKARKGAEYVGFPTQKPKELLEKIIGISSNPGDLVLDCFCGSGTTAVVAEESGRRWIAGDLGRFAIHTTRKRLLGVEDVKPFVIQNLGKYERQAWQTAEFGDETGARVRSYISFILKLYNAQQLNGYVWLHGKKGIRLVHVGSVDSPISPLDVGQIVAEFKRSMGIGKEAPKTNGVDILGWDFAFELNELAKQQAAQANVDLRFLRIPREVLDKKAVEQGDVHFFELASLDVRVKTSGKKATVTINDFVIPADDVPADIQKEIKHWSQWVDYWAVDWNNKNDTFHNEMQEYRTREKPKLATESSKTYDEHGEYRIVVKVIDILGNDTTKLLLVKV